jgi:hypothetical protein
VPTRARVLPPPLFHVHSHSVALSQIHACSRRVLTPGCGRGSGGLG